MTGGLFHSSTSTITSTDTELDASDWNAEHVFDGSLTAGTWFRVPSVFRLRLTGTGTVTVDSRNSLGTISSAVESYTVSGATDQIEFPYAGDAAIEIRVTLTGSATAEVI